MLGRVLLAIEPQVLSAFEPVIVTGGELAVFLLSDRVHGAAHVDHDVEAVKDDLVPRAQRR